MSPIQWTVGVLRLGSLVPGTGEELSPETSNPILIPIRTDTFWRLLWLHWWLVWYKRPYPSHSPPNSIPTPAPPLTTYQKSMNLHHPPTSDPFWRLLGLLNLKFYSGNWYLEHLSLGLPSCFTFPSLRLTWIGSQFRLWRGLSSPDTSLVPPVIS